MNPYETFGSPTDDTPSARYGRDEDGYGRPSDSHRRRSPRKQKLFGCPTTTCAYTVRAQNEGVVMLQLQLALPLYSRIPGHISCHRLSHASYADWEYFMTNDTNFSQ